jgi:feruloyl esterase
MRKRAHSPCTEEMRLAPVRPFNDLINSKRAVRCFLAAVTLAVATTTGHAAPAPASCESLIGVKLDHATISKAEAVPAGPFELRSFFGTHSVTLPAFCRVSASARPSSDSDIEFEVWLPLERWNGRFQAVGNGGLGGNISYEALAEALQAGYATASTDTGHQGVFMTGDWALGHPEKIKDYGYRAVHEMTVDAKAVIAAYYGSPARYAYWNGCSEGGGQGLSEARRYPDDYNGIVAGAPANYMVHLQVGGNWIAQAIHEDPATFIPASKLPMIAKAVLAQCDAADGVVDGMLEDPRTCSFDPNTLVCKGPDSPDCLTAPQAQGLKKVYDGAKNPRTGEQIFPGYMRGGEAGWGLWIAGTDVPPRNLQHGISVSFFSNFVFDNPHWDWKTFDFDKDVTLADDKVGAIVNQINPDLSAFKQHGGKLLQYHGWNDAAISPLNSVNYFTSVQSKMGDTQAFYRLFMVPGMEHCTGGPGPNRFDKMAAITQWVEDGKAPDQILASKPGRTRPLCPYPKVAKYKGTGSTDDASNFTCAGP